jgi:DNA-directed RNA polymerase subunit K/omega
MTSLQREFSADDFREQTDNIYEAILVIAKRSRQVGELQKRQIDRYLGQTEMAEQAAAQARAEDSEDALPPPEPDEPVDRPEFKFEKPVILSLRELKDNSIEFYYED